jgi:DNA-binding Lrp family transcriptional regulator
MPDQNRIDATDARLLLGLTEHPRATAVALAETVGLSRNTVQVRLASLERRQILRSLERRIEPESLGYPLSAIVTTRVTQRLLDEVAAALDRIPEVLQVQGLSGSTDLLVQVAAADGEDLYRIAGQILAIHGVERTNTALVMRKLIDYRVTPLLRRIAGQDQPESQPRPTT